MTGRNLLTTSLYILIATIPLCSLNAQTEAMVKLPQPSACVVSGEFIQKKTLSGISEPLESSGDFLHHCKHGIIWQTSRPFNDALLISNEQKIYKVEEGKLVALKARGSKMVASLIKSLMSGDTESIDDNFMISDQGSDQSVETRITLTPKSRRLKKVIQRVELLRPISEPSLTLITLLDKKGQTTDLIANEKMAYDDEETPFTCENSNVDSFACQALFSSLDED